MRSIITNYLKTNSYIKPLLEGRPNYYTFAKALAEQVVLKQKPHSLPVSIIRPSIVVSTYSEPVPGWVDNYNGAVGIAALGGLGIMRIADFEANTKISFIPVDMVSNALIVSAWHLGTTRPNDIQIYHLSSEPHNTPPILQISKYCRQKQNECPSIKIVRPIAGIPQSRPSRLRIWITILVSHLMFAYFVDAIIWLLGHKTMY